MKILWICPFFLHPTNRGAQIRTLGILKELHKRHEIHFVALNKPGNAEGPLRSAEYSSRQCFVEHSAPNRQSLNILPQILGSMFSPIPLAISRYASSKLRRAIELLVTSESYDSIVCDFLAAAPNVPNMGTCVLFQHNVETLIFQRHVEQSRSVLKKCFFLMQSKKMQSYESNICRSAKHVIAVSDIDSERMTRMFGVQTVSSITTGVDAEYFSAASQNPRVADILFCGSMDWLPNVDAVIYFLTEVLPLVRIKLPDVSFTIAGRSPDAAVLKAAQGSVRVTVTGEVEDMRPYLWGSKISVVPIRIGGGTRLKIYECMAAGIPVVSTLVGAEGLRYTNGDDIILADTADKFAEACIRLLVDDGARARVAVKARERAVKEFSWEAVSREFESILECNRILLD